MSKIWDKHMEHEPTREYADALFKITERIKPKMVLEIGTGWGVSGTVFRRAGAEFLLTVDPNIHSSPYKETRDLLDEEWQDAKVTFVPAKSADFFKTLGWDDISQTFDLIYVDGSHDPKDIAEDAVNAWHILKPGGTVVFDDFLHPQNLAWDERRSRYGVAAAVMPFLPMAAAPAELWPYSNNAIIVLKKPL